MLDICNYCIKYPHIIKSGVTISINITLNVKCPVLICRIELNFYTFFLKIINKYQKTFPLSFIIFPLVLQRPIDFYHYKVTL